MSDQPNQTSGPSRPARNKAPQAARHEHTAQPDPSKPGPGKPAPGKPASGLYITATPIGNLGDITLRALDLLRTADLIACEDTRITAKLLQRYGIDAKLFPYHDHNAARARPELLQRLQAGAVVALVSDAGTPLISDPGYKLVRACVEAGIAVTALPGASSVLAALCLAGLPTDRFLFAGFLPARAGQRETALRELGRVPATLVFLESPQRLAESLAQMAAVLGGTRQAAVTRELTKLYEDVRRGSLEALAAHYADAPAPKGEIAVVVAPPETEAATASDVDALLADALQKVSVSEAAALVAKATGMPKREVYARALALAGRA